MTTTTIRQLLNDLGEAFDAKINAANDDAVSARAELAEIKNGLRLIIGGAVPVDRPSTDTGTAETSEPVNSAPTARSRRINTSLPDEVLIGALDTDWATALEIRKALLDGGFKIAEGTVYNRMRKIAAARPEAVETASKPERWRLKPSGEKKLSKSKPVRTKVSATNALQTGNINVSSNNGPIHQPILHHGDCLDVMASIPDGSVDLILADLPYGVSGLRIDHRIEMDRLWAEYRRIIKPTGNIVLFGSQPFTTALINSAPDLFKYSLVWEKPLGTGYLHCREKPLKVHEDILIFTQGTNQRRGRSSRRATFNPVGAKVVKKALKAGQTLNYLNTKTPENGREYEGLINCPRSVLKFPKDKAPRGKGHPFAKPVAMLEYLIQSYSDVGEVVLDNTMGSGSTCIGAMRTGRRSIGIEQQKKWFEVAARRVAEEASNLPMIDLPVTEALSSAHTNDNSSPPGGVTDVAV